MSAYGFRSFQLPFCEGNPKYSTGDIIPLKVQCCGSVTVWFGSGSADPYHSLTDPDPLLFSSVADKQPKKCKIVYFWKFFCLLYQSSKTKSLKKVTKKYKPRFSYFFLLVDGRIRIHTKKEGSGSARPKIIRIHNTAGNKKICRNGVGLQYNRSSISLKQKEPYRICYHPSILYSTVLYRYRVNQHSFCAFKKATIALLIEHQIN